MEVDSASCEQTQDNPRFAQYPLDAPLKFPDSPVAKKHRSDIAPSIDVLEQANFNIALAALGLLLTNYIENVNPWHSFSLHTLGRLDKVLYAIFQTCSQRFQIESRVHWDQFAFGGMLRQPLEFPLPPESSGPAISCPPLLDLAERRFDSTYSRWTINVGMESALCRLYCAVEWATLHGATRWFCEYVTACLAAFNISCATIQYNKSDNCLEYDHPYLTKMLHAAVYMDNWRIFGTLVALFALLYNRPLTLEFTSTLRCFPERCLQLLRITECCYKNAKAMGRVAEMYCHCAAQKLFVWDCLAFPLLLSIAPPVGRPLHYQGSWRATTEELAGLVTLIDNGSQMPKLSLIRRSAWSVLQNDLSCLEALARRVVAHLHDTDTTLSQVLEQYFDAEAVQYEKAMADRLAKMHPKRARYVRETADLARDTLAMERKAFYPFVLRMPEMVRAFVNIIPDMFVRNDPKHMQRLDDLVHLLYLPMQPEYYIWDHT